MKRHGLGFIAIMLVISLLTGCSSDEDLTVATEITLSQDDFINKDYYDIWDILETDGFTNIDTIALDDLSSAEAEQEGIVSKVTINGSDEYKTGNVYMSDAEIMIYYHNIKMVCPPFSFDERDETQLYDSIKEQFESVGFTNIKCEPIDDLVFGWLTEDGEIESVTIGGSEEFDEYDSYAFDTEVVITYHTFPEEENDGEQDNKETESESETETEQNEILTVENCPELANILSMKGELETAYKEFAEKYEGRTIAFEGRVDYLTNHGDYKTRYDVLLSAGDYEPDHQIGPSFKFEDVNTYDMDLESDIFVGKNVYIIAVVEEFDMNSGLFYLDPVSVSDR